ncbi:MAG TPA: hypothetical protein VF483_12570, partial [Gemmatimonadaceae bacterium]
MNAARVLVVGLVGIATAGCVPTRVVTESGVSTHTPTASGVPQDGTREWTVRDSLGQLHHMLLKQETVVPGMRRITLADNDRPLYTMIEWWTKGLFGWRLESRDLIKYSGEGDSLSWSVTPGHGLTVGAVQQHVGRPTSRVLAAPGDEADGGGCGAQSLAFLSASIALKTALVALSVEPSADAYDDTKSAVAV